MKKFEKFYCALIDSKNLVTDNHGNTGYIVTLGQLIDNGGKNEFFRIVRGSKIGKCTFSGLEYNRAQKGYFATDYEDISHETPKLTRKNNVFIGFDY